MRRVEFAFMLKRLGLVLFGAFLLFILIGSHRPGAFLGFYPSIAPLALVWNVGQALVAYCCLSAFYWGLRPSTPKPESDRT